MCLCVLRLSRNQVSQKDRKQREKHGKTASRRTLQFFFNRSTSLNNAYEAASDSKGFLAFLAGTEYLLAF